MQQRSNEQLEERAKQYAKRMEKSRRLQLPTWWRALAPRQGPRFWCSVEFMRKEAGVERWDTSGMQYIIDTLKRRAS